MASNLIFVFYFWLLLLGVGLILLPITTKIFANFTDSGYIFAKILGLAIISYLVWLLGSLHILPFSSLSSWLIILLVTVGNLALVLKSPKFFREKIKVSWKIIVFEEILFFLAFSFWAYIRAHEPSIHGLEKFMDFGFINSILRTDFFPPKDLWLTPETINYYYFGHLVTAVLTKLSGIPLEIIFNLMIAALFALTFTGAFSLGLNLFNSLRGEPVRFLSASLPSDEKKGQNKTFHREGIGSRKNRWQATQIGPVICGLLSAFLVTLGGNLHPLYAFIRGFDKYWYPDATRFIPYTIHEFPGYSWVVSDLHGHVLDIPFVLLTIALLFSILLKYPAQYFGELKTRDLKLFNFSLPPLHFELCTLSFLLAVMYMTNAWDGLIYLVLTALVLLYLHLQIDSRVSRPEKGIRKYVIKLKFLNFELSFFIFHFSFFILILGFGFFLFSLPFNLNFKPFASGIGFVRDHSPLYMLLILWGFFYFFAASFLIFLWKINPKHEILNSEQARNSNDKNLSADRQDSKRFEHLNLENLNLFRISDLGFRILAPADIFVLLLIILSTLLLIFPEVAYVKDIYPLHYRANTMFKLGYQAFIMLSLSSAYIFMRIIASKKSLFVLLFFSFSVLLFIPVAIYPYFSVKSYYNGLKTYQGLNGTTWLKRQYPTDYRGITWLKASVEGQPVVLEAVGESYTDYARVSVFTGLPTVIGWPVHEWLWRGSYDEAGKRDAEVRRAYETPSLTETQAFLRKYQVKYVFIGTLERQKYPGTDFAKWNQLGKVVFQSGQTYVYEIN